MSEEQMKVDSILAGLAPDEIAKLLAGRDLSVFPIVTPISD